MGAEVGVESSACTLAARPGEVGINPEFMEMERETGLEPATPCLEGRYSHFHRLEAANPFHSSTSHRSTLYGVKYGSCQGFVGPPATACTQIVTEDAM